MLRVLQSLLRLLSRRAALYGVPLSVVVGAAAMPLPATAEVRVGVSDWPGGVAWYVAQ